jgi:3-oxoacyl-[acyl-carrier protein] reductase
LTALAGQVAIVTGAGRGIGRAVATALAREGAHVVLAARTRQELAAVASEVREAGGRALAVPVDVTQDAAVDALVDQVVAELGRVDLLVTAAGVAAFGPVAGAKPADWDGMLAVNLRAVMVCCRAVLPPMLRQRRGTIVNVASIAAKRAIPGAAAYAAAKAGVVALTKTIARQYGRDGVTAYAVAPGFVDTPFNAPAVAEHGMEPFVNDTALGEVAQPQDVANVIAFLASVKARHATGATVDVNTASYVR